MKLDDIEFAVTELNKNYDSIFTHIVDQCEEKIVINDPIKKCRFCEKSEPEVSFRKIAHAIPELIGNKKILTNNECDSCSEIFSLLLDDSLAKFLGLWRTLMQIKGKTGIVSYKDPDGISRIDYTDSGIVIKNHENNEFTKINFDDNTITINGFRQPYVPIAVFKCLVKIAISIIPYDLLIYFEDTKKWLLEDSHKDTKYDIQPIFTLLTLIPGVRPFGDLSITVARRKDDSVKVPFMQMAIYFGNLGFQIIVPCKIKNIHLSHQTINIFPIAHPVWLTSKHIDDIVFEQIDLSGTDIVKDGTISATLEYKSFISMEDNNNSE
jgi:hypothetical protein